MVRIPSEESFRVTHLSSSARKKRLCCRLGKNLRLVLILECETLFPETGRFPVTWHTLDIPLEFWTAKVGKNSGKGKKMWKCGIGLMCEWGIWEFENGRKGTGNWLCIKKRQEFKLGIIIIYKMVLIRIAWPNCPTVQLKIYRDYQHIICPNYSIPHFNSFQSYG